MTHIDASPTRPAPHGLVGSVIDSSTSLLHKQTHDIVRFAMGSPAAEAIPSDILAAIAADRTRARPTRSTTRRPRATRRCGGAAGDAARHQRRDHRRPADDHLGRHAGARPGLQAVRRPRRPGRRRVADLHQRQRDRAVLRRRPARGPRRRRRHGRRRARAPRRRGRPHPEGDLHDPDLPEPVRRHPVARAPAAAARARPVVGLRW